MTNVNAIPGQIEWSCGVCMEHMPRNVVFPPLLPGIVGLRSIKCPYHGTLVWVDHGKDGLWWTYDPTTLTWPLAEPQPVGVRTPEGEPRCQSVLR